MEYVTITIRIPKITRSWFRFSLRTFLLLTLLSGVLAGLFGVFVAHTPQPVPYGEDVQRRFEFLVQDWPGLQDARVTFQMPRRSSDGSFAATISLLPRGDSIDEQTARKVAEFACNHFVGLAKQHVTVVDLKTGSTWRQSESESGFGFFAKVR